MDIIKCSKQYHNHRHHLQHVPRTLTPIKFTDLSYHQALIETSRQLEIAGEASICDAIVRPMMGSCFLFILDHLLKGSMLV